MKLYLRVPKERRSGAAPNEWWLLPIAFVALMFLVLVVSDRVGPPAISPPTVQEAHAAPGGHWHLP